VKILLHTCCGPCSIHPIRILRDEGLEVMGYFYRSNIHPYTECLRREDTLKAYAESIGLKVVCEKGYELERFLQNVAFRESERCRYCYHQRLTAAARIAAKGRFDGFTTTLLYSKFQKHEVIASIGEAVAHSTGVPFVYRDFRPGWKEGVDESRRLGMYRQPYCGCIYSEKERYCRNP
jgi:predicted adenine nucleotide alpha hydrolase (AANH) superfamily ATPase